MNIDANQRESMKIDENQWKLMQINGLGGEPRGAWDTIGGIENWAIFWAPGCPKYLRY